MISLASAKKAIEFSEKKASELGITVTTVVVDTHGVPIVLSRMDGAFVVSPKFATKKATLSATLGLPSGGVAEYAIEGKPYFGINSAFSDEYITIAGGLPVKIGDNVVGGVGVGGSLDVNDDVKCAEAALKAFDDVNSIA